VYLFCGLGPKRKAVIMKNNLKYLIIVFILLFVVSYFVLDSNNSESNESMMLIPELKSQINDITSIIITKNEQTLSFSNSSGTWRILEANNYLADANMIATLLLDLRKLKLKEKKTLKPENYSWLSLDKTGVNAATQIKLRNTKSQFADVFIGKKSQNFQGTYVRKNNDPQTWLSEGSINIKLAPEDWIVSTIIDINTNEIKSVTYESNGEQFIIDRIAPNESFSLLDIPESMQLIANINLNDLANGLQKFNIESASTRVDVETLPMLTVTYQLFSGLRYHLKVTQVNELYHLNIDLTQTDSATDFDRQLENWTFVVAKYKFDALNKNLSDLIEEKSNNTPIQGQDD